MFGEYSFEKAEIASLNVKRVNKVKIKNIYEKSRTASSRYSFYLLLQMNPEGCQYDPLYGYTQPQARITATPDITTLTPFAPQTAPLGEYSSAHVLTTYDPYR